MSEALIFASTNPQYDDRLFIELQVQYMKIPSPGHGENMSYTQIVFFLFLLWHSEQFMYKTCSPYVLSLQFSCTELLIQWTIVILLVSWCKKKCFWKRFTCTPLTALTLKYIVEWWRFWNLQLWHYFHSGMKLLKTSIGTGKTIVLFFSAQQLFSVWR